MRSTLPLYAIAVIFIVGTRLYMVRASRKGHPFFPKESPESSAWSLFDLLLASFLTLFAELAFIRWLAVEVRVFAYFKNLALLLCFLGFGIGCALARNSIRWLTSATALVGLLLLVRWPHQKAMEGLS